MRVLRNRSGELLQRAKLEQREQELALYRYSCGELLEKLQPTVEEFNHQFQHGQITRSKDTAAILYNIPLGRSIEISFYEPRMSGIRIRNGELISGGYIGLARGRSANLLLLKHGADDLYGHWKICELKIMGLITPASLIGQFGLTRETVEPFGLKPQFFYDHMQFANGTGHVFNYYFHDDVADFFATLIREALAN